MGAKQKRQFNCTANQRKKKDEKYKNFLYSISRPQRGADDLDHSKLGGRALT